MLTQPSKVILAIIAAVIVVISAVFVPQEINRLKAEEVALNYAIEQGLEYSSEAEISVDEYLYERPEKRERYPFSDYRITEYRFFDLRFPDSTIVTLPVYKSPNDGEWRSAW